MSEIMDLTASDGFEEVLDTSQSHSYLQGLNQGQYDAVTASEKGGLQVLGTPGCGKTKTLTSRVAHLVNGYKLDPARVVVVTFTNKAANEMKTRLKKILGDELTDKLVMGTFHSVCAAYLRRYGSLVALLNNFSILDRDDSSSVIKRVIDSYPTFPAKMTFKGVKPSAILNKISYAKSKKMDPESYKLNVKHNPNQSEREWISVIWSSYQAQLDKMNAVDFDDLLIKGHELFKNHPHCVERIQTVLVDEFQDTSVTQYEIAKFIAKSSGSMTVVGDPDQSIYGWRNADVENLENMVKEFPGCRQIFLEQNYRSTNAILQVALAVIQQDKQRIKKSLYSSHPTGTPVVLHKSNDGDQEASFIAQTIQSLSDQLKGLVDNEDFAILLRAGYQSLSIELALQKAGIPSAFRGGHKFFDRAEVKDILSYLQLIANPHHTAALERILNVPKRALGDKASKQIFAEVEQTGKTPWEVITVVADGGTSGLSLSAQAKKGVKGLVETIRTCRKKASKLQTVGELISFVVDHIGYKAYLDKTYKGTADDRMLNIQELKNYAVIVSKENPVQEVKNEDVSPDVEILDAPQASTSAHTQEIKEEEESSRRSARGKKVVEKKVVKGKGKGKTKAKAKAKGKGKKKVKDEDYEDEEEEGEEEEENGVDLSDDPTNALNAQLQTFLSAASLATDTDTQEAQQDVKVKKVIISTVHSAKGLEWPVVFIPGLENGTYPFYLSTTQEQIAEERRLLYVAITRASTHLVLSHAKQRMGGGTMRSKSLSSFIDTLPKGTLATKLPTVTSKTREEVAKVLGRPLLNVEAPESDDVEIVESFGNHAGPSTWTNKRQSSCSSNPPTKKVKH